ncbi:MAG: N-acetyltransferase [Clostridia bacterium]|nr:N-acetyltransferase [Clostridia bacterium]
MLRFEPTTKKHIKEIVQIYNYYIANSTATFHTETINKKQMRKIVFFDDILYSSYTMFSGDEIIGYCLIAPFNSRDAYKATVYVAVYLKPDQIHKGYGKQALNFLEKKALGLPIRSLLALICAENDDSIRLFEKCGYEKVGTIKKAGVKFNRLLDVVYYQKIIRPNFL